MTTTNITRKHRLLFICLGNICRSPAAEGVMKAKVHAATLDEQFFIDSAGIGNWHAGQLPDSRMRERGARRGYRLDSRARQIRQTDFDDFDLLLVMDRENYRTVTSKAPDEEAVRRCVCSPIIYKNIKGLTWFPTLTMATSAISTTRLT